WIMRAAASTSSPSPCRPTARRPSVTCPRLLTPPEGDRYSPPMAPRPHRFIQVDVFTDHIFGGNPLAVLLDGRGIDDREMQAIAREMNLSETTFVLPATRPDCAARLRIFTPAREL